MRLFLLLCVCSTIISAAELIGPLSSLDGLRFTGNGPFSPEELRLSLLGNAETLLALHPRAPWAQAVKAIEGGLSRGYRSYGYPDVQVRVGRPVQGEATVTIVTGSRFMAGELVVAGCDDERVAQLLRDALLLPYDAESGEPISAAEQSLRTAPGAQAAEAAGMGRGKAEDALWPKEHGAPFHEGGLDGIRRHVSSILARDGLYQARFGVLLDRDEAAGTAALRIQVEDLGKRRDIEEILISGADRNGRAAVLERCGLKTGMPLSGGALYAARKALVDSGCFLAVELRLDDDQPGMVLIDLVEHEQLPLLTQEPGAAMAAAQRALRWLGPALRSGSWDLGISYEHGHYGRLDVIFAPERGLSLVHRGAHGQEAALLITVDEVRLRGADGQRLRAAREGGITLMLDILGKAPDESGNTSEINASAALVAEEDGPLLTDITAQPSVLRADYFTGATVEEVDGVTTIAVTLERNTVRWRIGAEGELLEIALTNDEHRMQARCGQDLFAQAVASWGDAGEEIDGWALLVESCEEINRGVLSSLDGDSDLRRGLLALGGLLRSGGVAVVSALQQLFPDDDDDGESFSIPMHGRPPPGMTGLLISIMPHVHSMSLRLAPYDHWLPTVTREATRVFFGYQQYLAPEIKRLFNDPDLGPVGCTALAWLLRDVQPTMAEIFADSARERGDAAHFRSEMAPIFDHFGDALQPLLVAIAEQEDIGDIAFIESDAAKRAEMRQQLEELQVKAKALHDSGVAGPEALAELLWQGGVDKLVEQLIP